MATVNKHKQRSRKTWQAAEGVRHYIFNVMGQRAAAALSNRLMRKEVKEGI